MESKSLLFKPSAQHCPLAISVALVSSEAFGFVSGVFWYKSTRYASKFIADELNVNMNISLLETGLMIFWLLYIKRANSFSEYRRDFRLIKEQLPIVRSH